MANVRNHISKQNLHLTKPVKDKGVSKGLGRQSEGNYIQGRDGR